jgi:hypothetical protein
VVVNHAPARNVGVMSMTMSASSCPQGLSKAGVTHESPRVTIATPLKAERGRSGSIDLTRTLGPVTLTGTLVHYDVQDPAVVDRTTYTLSSLADRGGPDRWMDISASIVRATHG